MKILSVVETAYRGTLEEQDDAALWLNHALKKAGGDIGILLRGNAVNYAVTGQDAAGIRIGGTAIERPLKADAHLVNMKAAGIAVHVVQEDVEERGIALERLVPGLELVPRSRVPDLLVQYDQVWHW